MPLPGLRPVTVAERAIVEVMANDPGWDPRTLQNASTFLSLLDGIAVPRLRVEQRAEFVRRFNAEGPDGLGWVPQPRGDLGQPPKPERCTGHI